MIAFTICARNFLAQALVLHDSLRRHHPEVEFHVALCDAAEEIEPEAFPFGILTLQELGIPDLQGMIGRYNISELNTSIKPFVFARLFERHPGRPVLYFDPDIFVTSPLVELGAELDAGADCVLTPHMTEPAEYAEMNERRILGYGAYNLGFLALRGTEEVGRIVNWWGRRLERDCRIDLAANLFVDQRWADLFPAFIGRTAILRHPGYNVAYWNLSRRTVRHTPAGWQVNGLPLRFFHFSGSVVDEPTAFTRHSGEFRLATVRDVGELFGAYVRDVRRFGRDYFRTIRYSFSWNGPAGENVHTPRGVAEMAEAATPADPRRAPPYLPLLRARSLGDYRDQMARIAPLCGFRRAIEENLIPGDPAPFPVVGYCVACGAETTFVAEPAPPLRTLPDGRPVPNWRESLRCPGCGLSNRVRACVHAILQELDLASDARVYLTEAVTPLYARLAERFPKVIGSEYLGPERRPGEIVDGVRHEDLERLSFEDATLEVVLSFDVLEHVAAPERAFAEIARCLRPGGTLLLTTPFRHDLEHHFVRAVPRAGGGIEHLQPPEFHANPVDPERGALCYRYFGWDVLSELRAAGFREAEAWFYWSRKFGYLGETNSIIVARR